MPSMDNLIAEYYAQNDSADSDIEKQAQVELFAKLAADNGIDLEQLSEDQIGYLWNETFKTASEEEKKEEEHDDKKKVVEKAHAEHEAKKEAAAKIAEADFLGRYMAHAMTDEIQKIAGAREAVGKAGKAVGEHLESVGHRLGDRFGKKVIQDLGPAKKELSSRAAKAVGAATYGTGGAALTGAALAAKKHHDKKKEEKTASAIDELAAQSAVEKAASAGWDAEEAAARVSSVLTLGIGESEKIAFAQNLESAVDVRSLELLEAAGYPVTWNE